MVKTVMLWVVVATYCCWRSESRSNCEILLSSVVNETAGSYPVNGNTGLIRGPNGKCVDIQGENYKEGTPVILWPCYENRRDHQTWILEENGDITSSKGEYCLTASGSSRGSTISIRRCENAEEEDRRWHMSDNGVIEHSDSKLVLSSVLGREGAQLTLEPNVFSSYQTWKIGFPKPNEKNLVQIHTQNDQCLQVLKGAVVVAGCSPKQGGHIWRTFADGTIRPQQEETACLSYNNPRDKRVVVLACGLTPSSERWLIKTSSNAILNERANLAIEMKGPREIIVNTPSGNSNQNWRVNPYTPTNIPI